MKILFQYSFYYSTLLRFQSFLHLICKHTSMFRFKIYLSFENLHLYFGYSQTSCINFRNLIYNQTFAQFGPPSYPDNLWYETTIFERSFFGAIWFKYSEFLSKNQIAVLVPLKQLAINEFTKWQRHLNNHVHLKFHLET